MMLCRICEGKRDSVCAISFSISHREEQKSEKKNTGDISKKPAICAGVYGGTYLASGR